MKKLFTFVAALMTIATINATQVVLNPADMPQMTTAGAYDQTVGGIKVQISNGIVNTSEMRIYKNQTITLTAESPISAIVFTCTASGTSQYGPGCFEEKEGYTFDKNKGTWDGSAASVTFKAASNQVRASKIVVYLDGEKPQTGEVKVDTIGVSEAIARIKASNDAPCYVKGVVAGDPFLLNDAYGPAFYMTDITNPSDSLEGFKIGKDANTMYKDADEMAEAFGMGDTILIYALSLAKYNDIYETTGGYFCKVLGKSSAIVLDWAFGSAYLEENGWTLDIAKANNDEKNVISLKIKSGKKDAIAGSYNIEAGSSLAIHPAVTAISAGSITLKFKEIGPNSLNIYAVQATFNAGDKIYRLKNDIEFFASKDGDEVVLIGDRPFKPTPNQEITCAQAKEYAMSLEAGATGDIPVVVVGYITDLFSNKITFWMDDKQGTTKTFQAYSIKSVSPVYLGLQNGAKVKVSGYVTNYSGTTPELKNGVVEIVEGGEQLATTEATVAEALAVAQALAQNASSESVYAITGYISDIVESFKADKGNMSFWMADNLGEHPQEFQAFRVTCTEELAAKLLPGAKVKVTAKVTHFHQDAKPATETDAEKPERTIYETVQGGTVELLAESGVEDIFGDVKAAKLIENGQIYIIRNGVRYNLQGQIAQ